MQNAQLKQNTNYGYEMAQTGMMTEKALEFGKSLVNQADLHEADLRKWAQHTIKETDTLIREYEKITLKKVAGPDRRIWEVAHWESEISRVTRIFFSDFANLVEELKRLNPPLTSSQIEPFLHKILDSRRRALEALTPMTHIIDRLTRLKSQLAVETDPTPLYRARF